MKMLHAWAIALLLSMAHSASAIEREVLINYDGEVTAIVTRDDKGRVIRMEHPDGSSPDLHLYYDPDGCLDQSSTAMGQSTSLIATKPQSDTEIFREEARLERSGRVLPCP